MTHVPTNTIAAHVRTEIERVKGSRFIADAFPVADEAACADALALVRIEFPDATHHCWAWRLSQHQTRVNDDGEPGGSAGAPILRPIVGRELVNTMVIVTRYYGGTKLGVGGLMRAYAEASGAVLDRCEIVVHRPMRLLRVEFGWQDAGTVQGLIAQYGLTPEAQSFDQRSSLTLRLPLEDATLFVETLRNRTSGRVNAEDV